MNTFIFAIHRFSEIRVNTSIAFRKAWKTQNECEQSFSVWEAAVKEIVAIFASRLFFRAKITFDVLQGSQFEPLDGSFGRVEKRTETENTQKITGQVPGGFRGTKSQGVRLSDCALFLSVRAPGKNLQNAGVAAWDALLGTDRGLKPGQSGRWMSFAAFRAGRPTSCLSRRKQPCF